MTRAFYPGITLSGSHGEVKRRRRPERDVRVGYERRVPLPIGLEGLGRRGARGGPRPPTVI